MVEEIQNTESSVQADVGQSEIDTKDVNEQKKYNVSIDYEANILDDYDSHTYHFRFFMMSPDAIRGRTFDPKAQKERIVIAESGATTIGIDDVSITSFPSPSRKHKMGVATHMRFTLQQPFGADLVDKIFAGAKRLGIEAISKVPFYLELSFKGREPDRTLGGTIFPGAVQDALLGGDDSLSDIVWVWPIILTDMNMTVDSGGSMYTLTAKALSDMAYSNQAADLEKKTVVTASTVKEFYEGLEKELNKKEEDKEQTNKTQAVRDTYKFYIDNEISASKIVPDNTKDIANRGADYNQEIPEKMEFPYEPGTSIDKITEDILSNTEYFQTKARGVSNRDAPTEGGNTSAITQTIYQLLTDTQLGDFDPIRNDYARHYRYLIVPYEMSTVTSQANRNANVSSQTRYDAIRNKGRLRKSYNYLYTGLNDQVFDFDISLNFSWYAAEQFMNGLTSNAQAEPTGKEADVDVDEKTDSKSLSEQFGLDPDSGLGEFVDDTSEFIQTEGVEGVIEGIATGDFDQLTGSTSEFLAENVAKGVRIAGGKIPFLAQDQLQEREQLVEDEVGDEDNANPMKAMQTFLESTPGVQNRVSGGYAENPGKIMLAQFFDQAAGPPSRDLLNISLRVKGDPFWLSPAAIGRNDTFRTMFDEALAKYNVQINHEDPDGGVTGIETPTNVEVTSADPTQAQQYFLFRNFTPQEASAESGVTPGFTGNNALNGVYGVRVVEHSFSGGQFTQQIDAVRDTQIAISDLNLGIGVADNRGLFEQWADQDIIPETIIDAPIDAPRKFPWEDQGGSQYDGTSGDSGPRNA